MALLGASLLSIYSYGHFARRAQGAPTSALPAERMETPIDRAIAPLTDAHPGQTGMQLLDDNLDAFALRGISARSAGRSLDLQYYIWHGDQTGKLLGYELLLAADRGVRVRLLLDDLNAHDKDSLLAALDLHPNIEIRLFNPSRGRQAGLLRGFEMLTRGFMLNRRMHNKAWIVDGRLAVVGGRNIGDEYFDASPHTSFFDVDLALCGPAVAEVSAIFDAFWNSRAVIPLRELIDTLPDSLDELRRASDNGRTLLRGAGPYLQRLKESSGVDALFHRTRPVYWTGEAHVYSDPPEKGASAERTDWLVDRLAPILNGVTRQLRIISPYFVPGEAGIARLRKLRARGVDIGVLTNSLAATDVIPVHGGYAPYRKPMLKDGVALHELMAEGKPDRSLLGSSSTSLHTKAFIADGDVGFVGSFNFDPRSVNLNTEMGIVFRQPDITAGLAQSFGQKTSGPYSYRLFLENDELRWEDRSVAPARIWAREPATSLWIRLAAKLVEWLPIESQL